jgi:hypothetical protein
MSAAAEDSVAVTFRLSKDAKCPGSTNPALQPRVSVLRRNCDGSVRRGAAAKALQDATAPCSGDGVFAAAVTAPYIRGDKCFAIYIRLADGQSKMAIVQYV